ncbi:DUF6221 family protein [Nocardia nova]|uniref:DUF6221 family protein n=1 Tax=Nocardia nova TaxID=37330 RepID=UPI00273907A8|nr:DUF6221 family protein [Nocardia nova]
MDIEDFIIQRIAEDEEIARATLRDSPIMVIPAGYSKPRTLVVDRGEWVATGSTVDSYASTLIPTDRAELATHIARHDPARVLRQCAALRWTLDLIKGNWEDNLGSVDRASEADRVNDLAMIAAIWSGHPDFRQEWAA